ncbi:MAG TPA: hypothetical protein ENH70_06090 [Desulfobacteraceae bacterium]|nr:hypothetical protein [Desulfobacteraceae bacterium]
MKKSQEQPLLGKITTRICPTCGHHEIGLMTIDGSFHPLKPGSMAQVFPLSLPQEPETSPDPVKIQYGNVHEYTAEMKAWAPEPVRKIRTLRLKYGVFLPENTPEHTIDISLYKAAFLRKLEMLLAQEKEIPVAVILDRFFTAPHLASGDSRQIAQSMWEELDEIRRPVADISDWLNRGDEASLGKTDTPEKKEDRGMSPPSPPGLRDELQALTLEDFLSLLTDTS